MKYSINSDAQGVKIKAQVEGAKQQKLLEELQKCASGQCSCPSPQYAKLEDIQISQDAAGVSVNLKPKAGEVIDEADIAKCLDHTAKQL